MSTGDLSNREKGRIRLRAMSHLVMGVVYLVFGSILIYARYFGAIEFSEVMSYILGSVMLIYGVFRIWRGITDMRTK